MTLRKFGLSDYEETVEMLYAFYKEVYSHRKISPKYFYYQAVTHWINTKKDIVLVANKDNTIVGFSMCHIDDNGCLTEQTYCGEIAYVKPEYRKTRAAYLLYKNAVEYASEKGLTWVSSSRVENGVSDMVKKHFDCKEMFISLEGI